METNGGGGGDIERLLPTWLCNANMVLGHRFKFRTDTLPLVTQGPGARAWQTSMIQRVVQELAMV